MSDTQQFTITIPNHDDGVVTVEQYGMLYPDNTYQWDEDARAGVRGLHFKHLDVAGAVKSHYRDRWHEILTDRAKQANLDPDAYIEQHRLVKRTVTVVAGKIEEV